MINSEKYNNINLTNDENTSKYRLAHVIVWITLHRQVSFHSIVEKFRPNGETEYLKVSISSSPGRIYHPERKSSRFGTRRPPSRTSTPRCSTACVARSSSIYRSGESPLAQVASHQHSHLGDQEDPGQIPPAGSPGPGLATPTSSSGPGLHPEQAAPASKSDALHLW